MRRNGSMPEAKRAALTRLEQVFHAALERDPREREAFVRDECVDADLERQVLDLLRAETGASEFLNAQTHRPIVEILSTEQPGDRIGAFRLVRRIGQGGMGSVWLADRADGSFEQQVAIKVIRTGIDTEGVLRRFHRERQMMARLRHPAIAQVVDGGATESGRPYLVMEYVSGLPLDRYCDANRLDVPSRLDLFRRVCAGVHCAHQHLIAHRDLKPSNILVTHDGNPKLLDFGIAKVLAADADDPLETSAGDRLLTPRYASPEQVRGETVTVASDVYSLGVVLFELLTGRSPYDTADGALAALAQSICETPPPRPSRVVQIMGSRESDATRADTRRVCRVLDGDLDTIVLKAIQKEPERRYSSVEQFSEDIARFRRGLPVLAQRSTWWYRARRFSRRHRATVVVSTAGVIGMAASLVVVSTMYRDAEQARIDAQVAAKAESHQKSIALAALGIAREEGSVTASVCAFVEDMFQAADPDQPGASGVPAHEVTVASVLETAVQTLDAPHDMSPLVESAVRDLLGATYANLSLLDEADAQLSRAIEIRTAARGPDDLLTIDSLSGLGVVRRGQGRYNEAAEIFERVVERRREALGNGDPQTLRSETNLAYTWNDLGRWEDAERLLRSVVAQRESLGESATPDLINATNALGSSLIGQRRFDEAEALLKANLEACAGSLGEEHYRTQTALDLLARCHLRGGKVEEAMRRYDQLREIRVRVLGENHARTLNAIWDCGLVRERLKQFREAEELFDMAARGRAANLGADHPDTLVAESFVIKMRAISGDREKAQPEFAALEERAVRVLDARHPYLPHFHAVHAQCLMELDRYEEAEGCYMRAYELSVDLFGAGHSRARVMASGLARLYERWARPEDAELWRSRASSP